MQSEDKCFSRYTRNELVKNSTTPFSHCRSCDLHKETTIVATGVNSMAVSRKQEPYSITIINNNLHKKTQKPITWSEFTYSIFKINYVCLCHTRVFLVIRNKRISSSKKYTRKAAVFRDILLQLHKPEVTVGTIQFVSSIHSLLLPPCLCVCSRLTDSSRFKGKKNLAIMLLSPIPSGILAHWS